MTECITCHQIKTEVEALLQFSAQAIAITLVCICQVDNLVVRTTNTAIIRSCRSLYTRNSIYLVAIVYQCQVLIPDIVDTLIIQCFQSHLYTINQFLFPSQVSTERLWIFEFVINSVDNRS